MPRPQIRVLPLIPGQFAWAHDLPAHYKLPRGLRDYQPILIVGRRERYYIVRAATGKEFELQTVNLETFYEYRAPNGGPWLPQDHPRVVAWLVATLERRRANPSNDSCLLLRNMAHDATGKLARKLAAIRSGIPEPLRDAQRTSLEGHVRGRPFVEQLERDFGKSSVDG